MTYTRDRHPHNAFCTDCGTRRDVYGGYFWCPLCDTASIQWKAETPKKDEDGKCD